MERADFFRASGCVGLWRLGFGPARGLGAKALDLVMKTFFSLKALYWFLKFNLHCISWFFVALQAIFTLHFTRKLTNLPFFSVY